MDRLASPQLRRLVNALRAVGRSTDDREVVALAARLGLEGLVCRVLDQEPSPARRAARGIRETALRDAAMEISEALAREGIQHFGARGIALTDCVYRLGDRDFADVDVYVRPDAATAAVAALTTLGFVLLPRREQSGPDALRPGAALVRWGSRGPHSLDDVHVDLHWGVEPVSRLLPRADHPLPEDVWDGVVDGRFMPVARPGHHAALLVHHLVHHDLLHTRGFVDLVLLRATTWNDGVDYLQVATALEVGRAALLIQEMLVHEFGMPPLPRLPPAPTDWRARRLRPWLTPEAWVALAAQADPHEHAAITFRRVRRRLLMLDQVVQAVLLVQDAVIPPRAHLRWRWPEATSTLGAWLRHVRLAKR